MEIPRLLETRNKGVTIAAFLFLLLPVRCFAGLGETSAETVDRYGPVVRSEQSPGLPGELGALFEFHKNGFRIQVRFLDGKVAWILYLSESRIPPDTIEALLENNAQGSKWSVGAPTENSGSILAKEVHYTRADDQADADYQELRTYYGLSIITKAWRRARSPETKDL